MYSRFGTNSAMVLRAVTEGDNDLLLAIDEKGLYLTDPVYLDKPKADPNRYSGVRAGMASRIRSLGLDPEALFQENRDRILKADEGGAKKKINPLKASKRSMGK
ncbi:MAG: hypothetical protein MJ061_05930 [Mailhella sp.]|nr:hypothetical protein [Mailhella sp.]